MDFRKRLGRRDARAAGDLFDPAMKDEIGAVVGDGLPFGDPSALVRVANEIARVLRVRIVSRHVNRSRTSGN